MRARVPIAGRAVLLTILLMLVLPASIHAQGAPAEIARAVSVQGTVEVQRAGQGQWQPVRLNDTFAAGDVIRVRERSRADLAMLDQSVLRLNADTQITVQPIKAQRTGVVDLLRGAAHFFSRGPQSLEVNTPFTVAGVRGTEFYVAVESGRTLLTVFEGTVLAQNPSGSLTLKDGQSAVAEAGKAPVLRVVARPRDAVQWTLYYPPVLYFRPDELPAGTDWRGMVRQSFAAYLRGDLQKAFDAIATVPPTVTDPRFFAYRAHLLLAVGRVDEATADIEQALKLNPNDTDALALRTIVAVAQNDKDRAFEAAQKAVQTAPTSATARIALSYAQQARFDLESARASLQKAVELDPKNALAWARLSELWAAFAELDRSLEAAQKAVALEPNLSRTQTVLGYAYLMQTKIDQAKEAFEKAIALDSADPLPRLGLGLAKIRDGELHRGSREIESAASLDPGNSIVRSYLGKAYYEEKRTPLAEREYATAKQLDPKDPTPWFYDAIAKQTTNRPVEALHSLERAIDLNDNRAVYRSELLLDADLAARSASLGRIYGDLGFQQLALVEGWKSVDTDPTNFSAHRLLSDTYAALPRHEIARVSELLQSQLLQPLNVTPIQPRLAESNLALISAGGPGSLSFNEFNPIFNRDSVTFQATGLGGENGTWAGEGVLAGIYKKVSFSLGYTHFDTNGWRANADQADRIGNAFVQLELTPQTSVQAEYRYRDTAKGEFQLNFFPDNFRSHYRQEVETNSIRVGARHAFTPNSILLGSFMYQHRDSRDVDHPFDPSTVPFTFTLIDLRADVPDQDATSWELQHLFRSQYVDTVAGAGYFHISAKETDTATIWFGGVPPFVGPGPLPPVVFRRVNLNTDHTNLYLYSYVKPVTPLTITLGASGDFFETESSATESRNQANPKLGIVWNPFPTTTVRAAAFRVLKRTLITDQTLEPTQVAGFNQFYDDINSTEAWRYGVALDQKFPANVYGGVELSRRDLSIPIETSDLNTGINEVKRGDATEYLARTYLFWAPHPWLALTGEYQYERFSKESPATVFFREVTTHRVPLGLRFFHPSGLGFSLKGTYVNQDGKFTPTVGNTDFRHGSDDFWVVDVGLSYRLPQRFGFVTVGATNLLDRRFRYQETDLRNPTIEPTRMFFTRVTLSF